MIPLHLWFESLVLLAYATFWTFVFTPERHRVMHNLMRVRNPGDGVDYVAQARASRAFTYALCVCIPFFPRVAYPYSWLVVIFLAPTVFAVSWYLLKRWGW